MIVRRAGSTTFLAGGHTLFAVHSARRLASIVDTNQPSTGAVVNTTAQVTPSGQLNAGQTTVVGQMSTIQVQAIVTAVAPGSITVSVNGTPLTIALPATHVMIHLDAADPERAGGTGRTFPWESVSQIGFAHQIMLAGGLGPDNVAAAIEAVVPFAVDASSRLESAPGLKDARLVRRFLRAARQAATRRV